MDKDIIQQVIQNKKNGVLDVGHYSSVLLPIIEINDELHILFQIRSPHLNTQPGEICFPGGKMEKGEDAQACAVRETTEELNIPLEDIEVFGKLDDMVTPFNMAIYSFCGFLHRSSLQDIPFNSQEVLTLFSVPISYLLQQEPLVTFMKIDVEAEENFPYHLVQQGKAYKWKSGTYPVYFYQYQKHIIWGITAKILKNFLDTIRSHDK